MLENVNIMLLRLQTLIFLQRMLIFAFFKQAINLVVLKIQTLFFDSSNFCSIILPLDVMLGVFLSHVQFRGHPSRYLSRAYTQSLVLSFSDSLLPRIFSSLFGSSGCTKPILWFFRPEKNGEFLQDFSCLIWCRPWHALRLDVMKMETHPVQFLSSKCQLHPTVCLYSTFRQLFLVFYLEFLIVMCERRG